MHIGIDCRLPTYQMGGISRYTIQLIKALSQLAADDQFTVFHSRKESRSFLPTSDPRFSRSDLWTPCHFRWERQFLAAELTTKRPDVFHSPDFIPPLSGATRRIITVHDLTFLYYPEFLTSDSRRYYTDQIEWAVSDADHVIADSEATRLDLIRLLSTPPGKVTTIHLAADPIYASDFAQEEVEKTAADFGVGRGFILAVGTLEPRKNLPTLLHAYARMRRYNRTDAPLLLVGGRGWMNDEIFDTIDRLDLSTHVRHTSEVSDSQLAHLYRAAGVLAFPSHYEGFGLPALEAMHSGCPVVASDRGSLPEVVGDAGILLEPDDVAAWADTLDKVLADAERAERMRLAGRIQAQKFSWEKTAASTLAIYRAGGIH